MARVIGKDNKVISKGGKKVKKKVNVQFVVMFIFGLILIAVIVGLIIRYVIKDDTVIPETPGIVTYIADYKEQTPDNEERIFIVSETELFKYATDLPDRYYVYIYNSNYGTSTEEDTESEKIEEFVILLFGSILTLDDVNIYIIDIVSATENVVITTDYEFSDADEQTMILTAPMILEVNLSRAGNTLLNVVRNIDDNPGSTLINRISYERQSILSE